MSSIEKLNTDNFDEFVNAIFELLTDVELKGHSTGTDWESGCT